jgi:AraC-like DNA-binding protein
LCRNHLRGGCKLELRLPLSPATYLVIAATTSMWLVRFVAWRSVRRAPRSLSAWVRNFEFRQSPADGGELHCIEVSLSPWATAAIFGPAEGWPEHAVPLNQIWQRAGGELEESLAGLPSWAVRFEMLDHILGVKIPRRCGPQSKLRWAWNEVSHLGGDARVSKLAASLGWSSRHFIAKFQEITGLTPKAQARRWRFHKARTYLDQTSLSLAEVAALCDYSDQSHLTREFRELGSCTPAAYRTVRFSDLPGLPAAATEAE